MAKNTGTVLTQSIRLPVHLRISEELPSQQHIVELFPGYFLIVPGGVVRCSGMGNSELNMSAAF